MDSKVVKTALLSMLAIGAPAFASGTFSCAGTDVKISGTYNSDGAYLRELDWKDVAKVSLQDLEKANTSLDETKLTFEIDVSGKEDILHLKLETIGAPESDDSEPFVYGGILTLKTKRAVENGEVINTSKAVAVTCSASY